MPEQSLQKNQHFFVRGFRNTALKRHFWPPIAILAEKSANSFARMVRKIREDSERFEKIGSLAVNLSFVGIISEIWILFCKQYETFISVCCYIGGCTGRLCSEKNMAQRRLYEKLKKAGEKNIYYISAEGMIGDDGEATVDSIHFTDLGAMRYVDHVLPVFRKALRKSR